MLIVIPARYASSRFPGKPLTPLLGKPLIQWTWEAANRVGGARVVVATDDFRIKDVLDEIGAEVVMTAPDWANGTERVAEAVEWLDAADQVVVNWQGDALLIDPGVVPRLVKRLVDSGAPVATPVVDVSGLEETALPRGGVEAVLNAAGECLWFTPRACAGRAVHCPCGHVCLPWRRAGRLRRVAPVARREVFGAGAVALAGRGQARGGAAAGADGGRSVARGELSG